MFEFAWPWVFVAAPLPWLLWRFLRPLQPAVALRLTPHTLPAARAFPSRRLRSVPVLLIGAWLCLLLAAARPQWVGPPQALKRSGRAMMLAVDISGSMNLKDMQLGGSTVSRFAAVEAIAGDFISRRHGDQVGLILFGSRAYMITPLTFDLSAVRAQLDGAAVGLAGRETAIGDAIGVAVRRLRNLPARSRVLVLLTDGVNNAGSIMPQAAARIAKAAGVRIYTIGIGATQMYVPGFFGMQTINPSAQLDAHMLKHIAKSTGGKFFRATDTAQLAEAYRTIGRMEPAVHAQVMRRAHRELFRWPLLAALLLATLGWAAGRALWRRREARA